MTDQPINIEEFSSTSQENIAPSVSIVSSVSSVSIVPDKWTVYIIKNKRSTYVGASPDPHKRLRKHNGELCGGARYTKRIGHGWTHVCIVYGFDKIQALQFEWAVKHAKVPGVKNGVNYRINQLYHIINMPMWTSNAPKSYTVPIVIEWLSEISDVHKLMFNTIPPYVSTVNFVPLL